MKIVSIGCMIYFGIAAYGCFGNGHRVQMFISLFMVFLAILLFTNTSF